MESTLLVFGLIRLDLLFFCSLLLEILVRNDISEQVVLDNSSSSLRVFLNLLKLGQLWQNPLCSLEFLLVPGVDKFPQRVKTDLEVNLWAIANKCMLLQISSLVDLVECSHLNDI